VTHPTAADTSRIDQHWPDEGLEQVERCPYCDSPERAIAHRDIQDWSFYCAPGKWTYWSCARCESLYLSPRPTPSTLANAYGSYYTHHVAQGGSLLHRLLDRLKNECWSHWLRADLRPRLHLPRAVGWLLAPLKRRLIEPFEIAELIELPKGRLMDVGCGNGNMLDVARQLGWQATGLEIDPNAARAARTRGLEVLEGSYARLAEFGQEFDCIICSHVLEHVHDPQGMLRRLANALKPGGTLMISLPNASSLLREHFGNDWRGLEAPRHLSIPSLRRLAANLEELGFRVRQREMTRLFTAAESVRIQRRGDRRTASDTAAARKLTARLVPTSGQQYDLVEFVCVKDASRVR
jgi:2-polyprenyl-3-methyl-5-hydroxy-6-metoxy-1,4-benzoquinol methylase